MTLVFFFKQKTAYEMRISDWSSDAYSSDLIKATAEAETQQIKSMIESYRQAIDKYKQYIPKFSVPQSTTLLSGNIPAEFNQLVTRSEERRVGKECGSTCRSRRSPYHENKNHRI